MCSQIEREGFRRESAETYEAIDKASLCSFEAVSRRLAGLRAALGDLSRLSRLPVFFGTLLCPDLSR